MLNIINICGQTKGFQTFMAHLVHELLQVCAQNVFAFSTHIYC